MTFRVSGAGFAVLAYLVAGSEAGLCRLSSSVTVAVTAATTGLLAPALSTSLIDTTSLSSSVLSNSSSSETATPTVESTETTTADSLPAASSTAEPRKIATTATLSLATTHTTETTEATTSPSIIASETTTSVAVPTPILINGGVDAEPETTDPWDLGFATTSLDQSRYFDGTRSLSIPVNGNAAYMYYDISQSISASDVVPDVDYELSLQFYPGRSTGLGCAALAVYCTVQWSMISTYPYTILDSGYNVWQPVSTICRFTQSQISTGAPGIIVEVMTGDDMDSGCWVDAVKFERL